MTQPVGPDQDDLPSPHSEDPPGVMAWAIAGCTLVLAYVIALALLKPAG